MPPDTVVVLPTYDEIDNLAIAVERIRAVGARVLIVDDASPDGTGELADRLAAADPMVSVLHRERRRGLGRAYADGFAAALAMSPDIVCQMDADLSHDPADVPRLVAAIEEGADIVVGSRYTAGGSVVGWRRLRRQLSRLGNRYARCLLRLTTADATSGFRAHRPTALKRLAPATARASGYAFQVEMTWRAEEADLRVVEVPIRFVERARGESKMSLGIATEAAFLVTTWGARVWWARLLRLAHLSSGTG